jgi:hypothetical protein
MECTNDVSLLVGDLSEKWLLGTRMRELFGFNNDRDFIASPNRATARPSCEQATAVIHSGPRQAFLSGSLRQWRHIALSQLLHASLQCL